jgi:hypothetical protein
MTMMIMMMPTYQSMMLWQIKMSQRLMALEVREQL